MLPARDAVVSRHPADPSSGWEIVLCERSTGVARVHRRGPSLEVTVGDLPGPATAEARPGESRWFTSVACQGQGQMTFRSVSAPPALLVGAGSVQQQPAVPGGSSVVAVAEDERVLMLSSAAFDALPSALVDVLRDLPLRVLHTDPADLLAELFADIPDGSGAVICRTASPSAPTREDR